MTTKISWTEETWNPVVGCALVSEGCTNCYAARQTGTRLKHLPIYAGLASREPGKPFAFTGEVRCLPERLDIPLRRRTPTTWFVNSMSDLFHPGVPAGFVMQVWQTMGLAPQHTFQVLTKRPKALAGFTHRFADQDAPEAWFTDQMPPQPHGPAETRATYRAGRGQLFAEMLDDMGTPPEGCAYPGYDWIEGMRWWPAVLDNVWVGASIELDKYVFRARQIAAAQAAVHFLSCEPLLGPLPNLDLTGIEWVIIGGESGPGARPMAAEWAADIIAAADAAGVPVWVKQAGTVLAREWGITGAGAVLADLPAEFQRREMP